MMNNMKKTRIPLLILASLTVPTQYNLAQTLGCDAGAPNVLNAATGQPGWTLTSSPGVTIAKPAVPTASTPGWGTLPGASWVSVDGSGGKQSGLKPGAYTYEFTFCVCQLQGATWTLSYFADNGAQVFMNGTPIPAAAAPVPRGFTGTPKGMATASSLGLVAGTNTLTLLVNNVDNVTGLDAVLKVVGAIASACPVGSRKTKPIDYQNPPLPEPPPDPFIELPVINQITNPPAPGKAFQPCSVAGAQGTLVGPTGPPVHTGGIQIQPETRQTVIFDPSVSEPSIDTTTDSWLANCADSVENEEADETVPAGFASQVDHSPEPVIDPLKIPPPPAPAFCGGNSTSGKNSTARLVTGPVTCPGGPPAPETCATVNDGVTPCALDCNLPFCGRDVILVHGYRLGPLGDWYTNDPNGALTIWPDNAEAFKPGGYWFEGAMDYWEDYIVNKLAAGYAKDINSQRMPRVLTIAYPVSQRIPIAASAMLSQISDAINCTACANTNVYTVLPWVRGRPTPVPVQLNSTNDTRHGAPFCTLGCVIVSHSTGGPVTNLAMYYAHTSGGTGSPQPCNSSVAATSPWVRISDCYVKAHVAIEPAFSGSNHAAELFAAGLAASSGPGACLAFLAALDRITHTGGITFTGGPTACVKAALMTGETNTTDLLPGVMVGTWQPLMKQSPVPTLIVATSHPVDYWPLMWGSLFPGFPDNTLTMDSQLGRPEIELTKPYLARPYVWVQSRRFLLDRANNGRWPVFFSSRKAFGYYVEQTNLFRTALHPLLPTQVSAAAIQYLTPTGMHIPLTGGGNIPANSVGAGMGPTTYTFLQASASHFWRWRFGDPAFNLAQDKPQSDWDVTDSHVCVYKGRPPVERGYNYRPIGGGNTDPARSLDEESRAVLDNSLYSHTNVNPSSWDGTGGFGADGIPLVSERMQNAVEGESVISRWPVWEIKGLFKVGGGIHWQRTYYRLKNWECEDFLDYINDFAVRR